MTVGHWYANGRYIMNPGVTGAFTWNGSTTNYALYAALVNSGTYTPDAYNDLYLSTAIASSAEPGAATGYLRIPVHLAAISKAQKTNPTSNYVIYPANGAYPLAWTVNTNQTLTAGLIIFYWDLNVANSLVSPLTAYYPSGTNNTHDSSSPLIAYAPFVDSSSGHNYWTTTASPEIISFTYDTSFTGYYVVIASQVS